MLTFLKNLFCKKNSNQTATLILENWNSIELKGWEIYMLKSSTHILQEWNPKPLKFDKI